MFKKKEEQDHEPLVYLVSLGILVLQYMLILLV